MKRSLVFAQRETLT